MSAAGKVGHDPADVPARQRLSGVLLEQQLSLGGVGQEETLHQRAWHRATQAEEKLRRESVRGKQKANQAHHEVGKKVRQTIRELGGTMPEHLATPKQCIQQIEKAKKQLEKKK